MNTPNNPAAASPSDAPRRRAIIVLGMHRSGTSVLARGLQALGVDLGHHLWVDGATDNAKGFWENPEVVDLNDRILAALAMSWHSLRPLPEDLLASPTLAPFRREAARLLVSHFAEASLWGIKDPRISRLLPFWLSVLDEAGIESALIIALRNPRSVAESLRLRDQFSADKSHLLWLAYNLPLLDASNGRRRVLVDYDHFIGAPASRMRQVADQLGISLRTEHKAAIEEFANKFVDPALRHSESPLPRTNELHGPARISSAAYLLLRPVARDEADFDAAELQNEWQQLSEDLVPFAGVIQHLDAVEDAISTFHTRRDDELRQDIAQRDAELERLQEIIDVAHQDLKNLDRQLTEERYTVVKPLARNAYQRVVRAAMAMPPPVTRVARKIKRTFLPQTIALHNGSGAAAVPVLTSSTANAVEADPWVLKVRSAEFEGHDVVVFPVIDWHFRVQRPQHLARHLAAAGHRVFYLSTTFADGPSGSFRVFESPAKRVYLCQLGLPTPHPNIYEDLLRGKQQQALALSLKALAERCGLGQITSIVDLPFWRPIAEAMPGSSVVYDCMDYHAGFSSNTSAMLEEEDRLLREADLVITTAERLSDKVAEVAPNTVIRNAGEIDFFRFRPEQLHFKSARPVVGYFGAISEWFDIELLCAAARHFSNWDFVLVGSVVGCDTQCAKALANVTFVGEVAYDDLPGWLHAFDVCTIPFKVTELTLCTNPVKVYEYLAAGKPVVATELPEVRLMEDYVHLADDEASFIVALDTAMAEKDDQTLAGNRTRWALTQDWTARAGELDRAIEDLFPKVSIIVLTYNNLDFTRACLSSIERFTHYPDWELIIVDNASKDDSPDFLRDYADRHEHVRLFLNEENLGFSGGNNVGLAAADGDVLVILNNDTQATPGWLTGLTGHLRRNPDIGLLGPVTNNIGNEAKLDIEYDDSEEMLEKAYAYTSTHVRELLYVNNVAFFCAVIPHKVYAEVGPMDENFGRGFFEDDDYSMRVRQAGYKVAIADDVFIHHHLSASFSKLPSAEKQQLFENGKKVYEAKWGPWTPHKYRN